MKIDEKPCDFIEAKKLYNYLLGTPVANMVTQLFNDYNAQVYKAQIQTQHELGATLCIWSNLGGVRKEPKYKIQEAYSALEKTKNVDQQSIYNWMCVNEYIRLIGQGSLELIITAVNTNHGYMIIDGNKRATAFYEYHRIQGKESIDFPLYILQK